MSMGLKQGLGWRRGKLDRRSVPAGTLRLSSLPRRQPWPCFNPMLIRVILFSMQLRGCGTALVTPFLQDGSLDEPALRNLVAWQIDSGIDFLVPCGTTGETPTLSHEEWLRVIDITIEV